jgi:glycosyl hydrolase family 57
MNPQAAAADLHARIRSAAGSTGEKPAVISVILDGENAWEFYPGNGREFLKAFYARLAADPDLQAVTATEALAAAEQGNLSHIVPGSWINANFDIWIGAAQDNRAWDLLWEAREFFAGNSTARRADSAKMELARQELWVAEGSDWCWWYGPEHSSPLDEEFDLLYRKHLSNVYGLLGGTAPDELAYPIKEPAAPAIVVAPTGRISPRVDGVVTDYFEWIGAGYYQPDERQGAMHGGQQYVESLYYGYSGEALFVRMDFREGFTARHRNFEIRLNVDGNHRVRIHAPIANGKLERIGFWRHEEAVEVAGSARQGLEAAFHRIFELRLDFSLAGLDPKQKAKMQVSLWVNELPLQTIPSQGWLTLELAEELMSW